MDFINDNVRNVLERIRVVDKPHKENASCHEYNLSFDRADD
jgi:hypothetical protein